MFTNFLVTFLYFDVYLFIEVYFYDKFCVHKKFTNFLVTFSYFDVYLFIEVYFYAEFWCTKSF